jgi:uncharacterized protein YjiS (DUF1127 family)
MTASENGVPSGMFEVGGAATFRSLFWAAVASAFYHKLTQRFKVWVQLDSDVSELAGMSDRELRDVGIDRMDIAAIRAGTCKRRSKDSKRVALSEDESATLDRLDIDKPFQVPASSRAIPMDGGVEVIGD